MQINLTFDAAAQSAGSTYTGAIQQAANIIAAALTDNITLNIDVGVGDLPGPSGGSVAAGGFVGVPAAFGLESYSSLVSLLASEVSGDVLSGVNALPAGSSIDGQSQVEVSLAEEKALGLVSGSASGIDGYVGIGTGGTAGEIVVEALNAITQAMGRLGDGPTPDLYDLYRYTSPGELLFSNAVPSTAAYFSLDGGVTDLADYGLNTNPANFLDSVTTPTPGDAFNETLSNTSFEFLTQTDLLQMEALGFHALQHPEGDFFGTGAAGILLEQGLGGPSQNPGDLIVWPSTIGAGPQPTEGEWAGFFGEYQEPYQFLQMGDFNGYGLPEALLREPEFGGPPHSAGAVEIYSLTSAAGTGVLPQYEVLGPISYNWYVVGSGDFSGAGPDQILWRNDNGDLAMWTGETTQALAPYSNGNNSAETFAQRDFGIVPNDWVVWGVGDLNGDGKADILWRNSTTGDVGVWYSEPGAGSVNFTYDDLGPVDSAWIIQGIGDFNGDGKADILWRNPNTGDIGLWLNDGHGAFTYEDLPVAVPLSWHIEEVADFNGDGKADILWYNSSNFEIGWWAAGVSGGAVTFTAHYLGAFADSSWQIDANPVGNWK